MKKSLMLVFVFLLLTDCGTPKKSLQNNNYNKAFKQALRQLERGKSVRENKAVLSKSLGKILKEKDKEKERLLLSDDIDQRDRALAINGDQQDKILSASFYLGDAYQAEQNLLEKEASELEQHLSSDFYHRGREQLEAFYQSEDKELAQSAYFDFKKSGSYGAPFADVDSLAEVCYQLGLIVYTVEADAPFDISYQWEIDREFEDIEDYDDTFLKIYYERNDAPDADCHLEIEFGNFRVDTDRRTFTEDFSESVQTGTTTTTNDNGDVIEVPVYKTVEGRVVIQEITKTATYDLRVDIRSYSQNCDLRSNRFSERLRSQTEETQLEGDSRAIPSRYKGRREDNPMRDDEMAEELIRRLYREVVRYYF